MPEETFNTALADSQGTEVPPLSPRNFDLEEYSDYESGLLEGCEQFWKGTDGVAVYRRFRVPGVYSGACADKKLSLELQLSALKQSMSYQADIPNFLEPWYGIGVVASAFGIPYQWKEGQAPAVEGIFKTAREGLNALEGSVAASPAGRHVMEMIEYFLDKTRGKLPISLTDTQSPLNIVSSYLMDSTSFMYEIYDNPGDLKALIMRVAELEGEFLAAQKQLIGDALASPGHGFASSRVFSGVGFSDDNILMFSDEVYEEFALPALLASAGGFEGPVFHSCGNWSGRTGLVTRIPGLIMADGAVGNRTDPSPNNPEALAHAFSVAEAVLHVRIVGDSKIVGKYVPHLRKKGLKTIITTYCENPEDQKRAYDLIHNR